MHYAFMRIYREGVGPRKLATKMMGFLINKHINKAHHLLGIFIYFPEGITQYVKSNSYSEKTSAPGIYSPVWILTYD